MKILLHFCLGFAWLLTSCERPKESGKSESESNLRVTHAKRPSRVTAENLKEKHRVALDAAMSIEPSAIRDEALATVVRDALKSSPEISAQAFKLLSPDSKEKASLLQFCAEYFVERKPEEAFTWADTLGLAKDVTVAKVQIARSLADLDPIRAMKLLSSSGMEIGQPGSIVATVALRRWASKAPADAVAWAIKCPPGVSRKAGIKAVIFQWIRTDPPSALSWMAKLDDDTLRREASRAMAEVLVETPPPLRDSFLQSADQTMRSELEQQVEQITKEAQQVLRPAPAAPANPTETTKQGETR